MGNFMIRHALEQEYALITFLLPALAACSHLPDELVLLARPVTHGEASLGRFVETGDAVEDGRLARSIRTDKGRYVASPYRKGEIAHSHQTAEAHGEVLDRENRVRFPIQDRRGSRHCCWFSHGQCPSPCATR